MEKTLSVLPNFTILAENTAEYRRSMIGILRCFCEVVANVEHVDNYKITPESFWSGMNRTLNDNINFIELLKNNVKEDIPENVLKTLNDLEEKFGVVTLIGDDCLRIKNQDIIDEIQNSSKLKEHICLIDGDLVFFQNIDLSDLNKIFEYEIGYPIKVHQSAIKTFVMLDGNRTIVKKAKDAFSAFKSLYNSHPRINEDNLKEFLKHKKDEVAQEDVDKYLKELFDLGGYGIQIKPVNANAINEPQVFRR